MDYTNQPLGLRVQTQIPLNVKEYKQSEQDLKNLGLNNNLAFTYEKGLIVYCVLEGTRYEWKEYEEGDDILLDSNFIYPNNIITFGIDYSNKEYNFVRYGNIAPQVPQDLQSVLNVGDYAVKGQESSGQSLYKMDADGFETSYSRNNGEGNFDFGTIRIGLRTALFDSGNTTSFAFQMRVTEGKGEFRQRLNNSISTVVSYEDPTVNTLLQFPAKSIPGTYRIATEDMIPVEQPSQKIITYPTDFTGVNYTLISSDNNKLLIVDNGATNITITVPTGLPSEFFSAFIRKGTGEVTFLEATTIINSSVGKRINRRYDQVALDKEASTTTFYLTGNTKV